MDGCYLQYLHMQHVQIYIIKIGENKGQLLRYILLIIPISIKTIVV